jgi:hypothetical protein
MRGGCLTGGVEEKWADVRRDLNTLVGRYREGNARIRSIDMTVGIYEV